MKTPYFLFIFALMSSCKLFSQVTNLPIESYKYAPNSILIDVRTSKEYTQGHMDNAINIDFLATNFEEELNKLDKKTPIYLYCRSGKRSAMAVKTAKKLGFKYIFHLDGGYLKLNPAK